MAGERTVAIKFTGETKDLDRAAGNAKKSLDEAGNGLGTLGEKADGAETSLIGIHDVIDGTATIMQGPGEAGLVAYIQGWADLAGGIAPIFQQLSNLSLAVVKNAATHVASAARVVAGWVMMGLAAMRQAAVMATAWLISLGPIALIIAAIAGIVAAILVLWFKSSAFRDFVIGAWGRIQAAFAAVWSWVKAHWPLLLTILTGPIGLAVAAIIKNWDRVVGFVKGLPGRIAGAASGMWDGVKNAFRSAINWIIRAWNNFHISIPGVDTHIPGVGKIGGFTLSTPDLPLLDAGGRILETGLAMVHKGETVNPARTAPLQDQVIELHLDLGQDIQRVVRINLSEHDRQTRRRVLAGVTR